MNERLTKDNRYSQNLTLPCYDTDARFLLKPASFMDLAQELAYWAAQELGFGYDDLQKHHTAWVLSRMQFRFRNTPRWRDEVTLYTWHKGLDGIFFLRDFELRAKGDTNLADKASALVSCTSSWIVMDTQTRRLVRSDEVLDMVPSDTQCPDDALKEPAPKVTMPRGVTPVPVGTRQVSYADVDIIGHTNNARYIVWAMDCLTYEEAAGSPVKEICINFNKETVPGETVELFRHSEPLDGGMRHYIEGKSAEKSCFCARIDY